MTTTQSLDDRDPDSPAPELLSRSEWSMLADLAEILFPSEPDGVGAVPAGALAYVDSALRTRYAHLVGCYQDGLRRIQELAREEAGSDWIDVGQSDRESLIADILNRAQHADLPLGLSGSPAPAALEGVAGELGFILVFWQHVREGLFSDPRYGGNKDGMVWKWLGYPGPQMHGYTDSEVLENAIPQRPLRIASDWLNDASA